MLISNSLSQAWHDDNDDDDADNAENNHTSTVPECHNLKRH